MTEVTTYPLAHHQLGGSRRLLAPTPEHRTAFFSPDLFRDIPLAPMDYPSHFGLQRSSSSADRSMSVSSTASSASHHTPFRSDSRALSPASVVSEPASSILARSHHQLSYPHQQQPQYASHAPPSALLPGNSSYLQAQVGSPMPLYGPIAPNPRAFGQQSPYNFQVNCLPPQPSPLSYQQYPPIYPSFATNPTYPQCSPQGLATYQEPSELLQKLQQMPPEVLRLIGKHLGYLFTRRLLKHNRLFRDNFDASIFSEDEKIAGVLEAEQCLKRYHLNGKDPQRGAEDSGDTHGHGRGKHASQRGNIDHNITPRGSFACYHCFRMRSPDNFELFKWHYQTDGDEAPRENDGDDTDSYHSTTTASAATTPRQRNPSLPSITSSSSTTSNPYYDPSITRSSIRQAQASARNNPNPTNRSNSPSSTSMTGYPPSSSSTVGGGGAGGGSESPHSGGSTSYARVKATMGVRRFCVDCGVRKRYYRPRDLINLHGHRDIAKWICQCWKVHLRPADLHCDDCGDDTPFVPAGGRRRGL